MPAFPVQRLPGLAFREVVQSMEPMDILFLTQASLKTRCMMSRNARLPITFDVDFYAFGEVVLHFCGNRASEIIFNVKRTDEDEEDEDEDYGYSGLWKYGKDENNWSETTRYNEHSDQLNTHWSNTFDGYKAIVDFLADTFYVKRFSFQGSSEGSYDLLKYIAARNLPIQRLQWSPNDASEAVLYSVLTMAIKAKVFDFKAPLKKTIRFNRFNRYSMNRICLDNAYWITRENLCALSNCLEVEVHGSKLNGKDFNVFLKYLIRNPGRAKEWNVWSDKSFKMKSVLNGIEHEEIEKDEKYIVERNDGVKMKVKFRPFAPIACRYIQYVLKVKVVDPST